MKKKEIKKQLLHKTSIKPLTAKDYVSTGSTLLNLAISGNPFWGFAKGHYYYFVGDTQSGKTWLSLTCLAEASLNKNFKKHRFIFDNGEEGALMDIKRYFGKRVAERIEAPRIVKGEPVSSYTLEDFYFHVDDALQEGKPFIYILDSMDSLTSKQELEKFEKRKKAARKRKKITGSMGDGKAKINSQDLRQLLTPLKKTGSILIIINQTRDNLKVGYGIPTKTRSGGHAPSFYACLELWSSVCGKITKKMSAGKTKKKKNKLLGTYCKVRVKKNRMIGKDRTVIIPIFNSVGIDDIGSCIDYLLEEYHWSKKLGKIKATEFGVELTKNKLVEYIEQNNMEKDLRETVSFVWDTMEKQCEVHRKFRYV
jgi:recombination protein RecA